MVNFFSRSCGSWKTVGKFIKSIIDGADEHMVNAVTFSIFPFRQRNTNQDGWLLDVGETVSVLKSTEKLLYKCVPT